MVMQRVNTLEILLDKNDGELRGMLNNNVNIREEEIRRLLRAMFNLKRCREAITVGTNEPNELFWDSWDRHHHIHNQTVSASPRTHRSRYQQYHRTSTNSAVSPPENTFQTVDITIKDGSVASGLEVSDKQNYLISPEDTSASTLTPSPSPPNSPSVSLNTKNNKRGFNNTPPARKKHMLSMQQQPTQSSNPYQQLPYQQQFTPPSVCTSGPQAPTINAIDQNSMPKSRSQELQWNQSPETASNASTATPNSILSNANSHFGNDNSSVTMSTSLQTTAICSTVNLPTPRSRLHTEPSPDNYNDVDVGNLNVPRSPCTPKTVVTRGMGMGHTIAHRFAKKFNVMYTCDLCNKPMFFGLKCKECKYRCHRDCEGHVPPSCGLPPAFIDEFKKSLPSDVFLPNTSPSIVKSGGFLSSNRRDRHRAQAFANQHIGGPDSSSAGSSCMCCIKKSLFKCIAFFR